MNSLISSKILHFFQNCCLIGTGETQFYLKKKKMNFFGKKFTGADWQSIKYSMLCVLYVQDIIQCIIQSIHVHDSIFIIRQYVLQFTVKCKVYLENANYVDLINSSITFIFDFISRLIQNTNPIVSVNLSADIASTTRIF